MPLLRRKRRHLAGASLLLITAAVLGWWLLRPAGFVAGDHPGAPQRFQLSWHGQPVGVQQEQLQQLASGVWQLTLELDVNATVRGASLHYREREQLQFAATPPHRLLGGSWLREQNGGRSTLDFHQDETGLIGQRQLEGKSLPVQQPSVDFTLADYYAATSWVRQHADVGARLPIKRLHTESLQLRADSLLVLESGSYWTGQPWRLAWQRAEETYQAELLLAPDGQPLAMTLGDAVQLQRLETDSKAAQASQVDLYLQQTIETDRSLGAARNVVALQLRWPQNVALPLSESPGQVVLPGFVRTDVRKPGLAAVLDELQLALADEPAYSPADPRLQALAVQLTAGTADPREKVSRLLNFVSRHVRNEAVFSEQSAAQILRERRGDCTEFSRLFVALARAAAVPAREVSGLVYLGDDLQRFGGHSWAEVIVDGRWLAVDPMWNLMPVSGTHLRMGSGDAGALATTLSRRDLRFAVEQVFYR